MQIAIPQSSIRHGLIVGAKIFLQLEFTEKMTVILPAVLAIAKAMSYMYNPAGDFVHAAKNGWKPCIAWKILQNDSKAKKLGMFVNWVGIALAVNKGLPYVRKYGPIILGSVRS